jgi:hypothetical protein
MLDPHEEPEKLRWLPGARLNIAECALRGWDPDAPALVWAAEGAPERLRALTLDQLRRRAYAVAASLRSCGYRPGDEAPLGRRAPHSEAEHQLHHSHFRVGVRAKVNARC